jgi:hypothetical protein
MVGNNKARQLRSQLWGWILFILCSILFAASSVKNGIKKNETTGVVLSSRL